MEIALKIYQQNENLFGQSSTLYGLSTIYLSLDNKTKANELIYLRIKILQSPNFINSYKKNIVPFSSPNNFTDEILDQGLEYSRRLSIGDSYTDLEDYNKALEFYETALQIVNKNNDYPKMRNVLASIANAYYKLEKWNNSAEYYRQALEVSKKTDSKFQLAGSLSDYGSALVKAGKLQEALQNLNESLRIYQEFGVGSQKVFTIGYGFTLNFLSQGYYSSGNKRLAIFYGKQAINAFQLERERLKDLDIDSQKGYLRIKEKSYRRLADWLFEVGRFAEAEQVLRMLKEEEFSNFVRRDPEEIDKLGQRLEPNAAEKPILAKYSLFADNLAKIGVEYEKLIKEKGDACQTDARCQELKGQLEVANKSFTKFLKDLDKEFSKIPKRDPKKEIEEERENQENLQEWNAVSIYTLVGEERLRVFLTTPQVQTDRKKEIKAEDLNKKIRDFREALTNPCACIDPRPFGKELYDILIAPLQKQIDDSGAKTLLFSLDGTLRYIPIAALWDGKQYLVEKYQIVILTSATKNNLTEKSRAEWKIFGGGVSEESKVSEPVSKQFHALPEVRRELDSIVRGSGTQGIFDGRKYLDKDFTKESIESSLSTKDFNVLHLATHFNLGRDDGTSFLLLGNNQTLTLEQISSSPSIKFGSVDLVVLSACETAFGNSNDSAQGGEVDSSATFFELKGAKSVIASLWSVADNSTSELMIAFYQIRRENPQLSKAEALRLAQVKLLNGKYKTGETPFWRGAQIVGTPTADLPPFKTDINAPFAHPYYWSPFILIGNWK